MHLLQKIRCMYFHIKTKLNMPAKKLISIATILYQIMYIFWSVQIKHKCKFVFFIPGIPVTEEILVAELCVVCNIITCHLIQGICPVDQCHMILLPSIQKCWNLVKEGYFLNSIIIFTCSPVFKICYEEKTKWFHN